MDNLTRRDSARQVYGKPRNGARGRPAPLALLAVALAFCSDPASQGTPPVNVKPTAAFTAGCTDLSCSFIDASTDPDGTIVSRVWNYGDGSPASAEPSRTYSSSGTYDVTLTVTDNTGAENAVIHEVTVNEPSNPPPPPPPPGNSPPTAAFTSSCNALACTFSNGSTDTDGTIASRSWAFGDGSTSTTNNPAHTYAAGGTYSVSLTVVDNGGANGSVSHQVTVAAATGSEVTFIGAGDIANCNTIAQDDKTAAIIDQYPAATVYTVGDNAYPDGTATDFSQCYEPTWGRFKSRTRPAPGNHDYHTAGAPAYFAYFGASAGPAGRGYYSYDLGSWHIISLNSEIDASATSAQATWLAQDLASHPAACTLAYWHKPLFTSSSHHAPDLGMQPLFTILYDAGADVVLSAHNHQYERFAPQRPDGTLDQSNGVRDFVVGSGGAALYDFGPAKPNSEVRYKGQGVLKLTLKATSYDWEFLPIAGASFTDSGSGACH